MKTNKILTWLIAAVWIANGFFCKVLNLVPRHREIVARIIGNDHATVCTKLIGCAEIAMAIWIIIGYKPRLAAIVQTLVIATMNTMEFFLAPDLLLWGRHNALYAFLFILVILANEFYRRPGQPQLN
jgi:uncharacterized membrane protein YphA (DoxX/SURF4 family)